MSTGQRWRVRFLTDMVRRLRGVGVDARATYVATRYYLITQRGAFLLRVPFNRRPYFAGPVEEIGSDDSELRRFLTAKGFGDPHRAAAVAPRAVAAAAAGLDLAALPPSVQDAFIRAEEGEELEAAEVEVLEAIVAEVERGVPLEWIVAWGWSVSDRQG